MSTSISISTKAAKACVVSGSVMVVLLLVGFLIADFIPPPSPEDSAGEIGDFYRDDTNAIRFGLLLTVIGAAFLGPFVAVISVQLRRIEGRFSAPLAQTQLAMGALAVIEFIIPEMLWQAAAFRGNRSDDSIQTLNDAGWLMFLGVTTTFVIQLFAIGAAILADQRAVPVFPRWAGYFNIWIALMIGPGALCVFFKDGPFAWNGPFAWWIPLCAFCLWFPVMTVALWRAIDSHAEEAEAAGAPASEGDLRVEVAELRAELVAVRGQLTN